MRILAGLLLGFLAAIAFLLLLNGYAHFVADVVQGWAQQSPHPTPTLPMRALVGSGLFVAEYLVILVPIALIAFPLAGWRLAVRSSRSRASS